MGYSGITENYGLRHANNDKAIGKSGKQSRGPLFYGEGGRSWEGLRICFILRENRSACGGGRDRRGGREKVLSRLLDQGGVQCGA